MDNTTEYARKLQVAAEVADAAWVKGGLEALERECREWRMLDADPVILAELARLVHRMGGFY